MTVQRTLVSTVAGGPQVVTFCLDELLRIGEIVDEVIVVHLSPQADSLTGQGLIKLEAEFSNGLYTGPMGRCSIRLHTHPIRAARGILADIRDEQDAQTAWSGIYALVGNLKAQGRQLDVCISGGRRMLALLALSAATLHFDHLDRLWHMYTPNEFLNRAANGAILHARPEDGVRLIEVPMLPWGAYLPRLRTLAQPLPNGVLAAHGRIMDRQERARCRRVIAALTPRQEETLRAFAEGGSPQDVAEELCVTLKTVDSHKTVILAHCRAAWELPPDHWLDYHFIRERFSSYWASPV